MFSKKDKQILEHLEKENQKKTGLALGVLIIFLAGYVVYTRFIENTGADLQVKGVFLDQSDAMIYLPSAVEQEKRYPLIVSFSPDGNANSAVRFWQALAEKHKLIIYASKIYRNHTNMDLPTIKNYIDHVVRNVPVNRKKIIFTGLSGGGSFSHLMNLAYPGFADAVIINTGKFWELDQQPQQSLQQFGAARNKVVFIASPSDFRYQEMQRDYNWMHQWGFAAKWIEFSGGHQYAPHETYDEALTWIFSAKSPHSLPKSKDSSKAGPTLLSGPGMNPYSYK